MLKWVFTGCILCASSIFISFVLLHKQILFSHTLTPWSLNMSWYPWYLECFLEFASIYSLLFCSLSSLFMTLPFICYSLHLSIFTSLQLSVCSSHTHPASLPSLCPLSASRDEGAKCTQSHWYTHLRTHLHTLYPRARTNTRNQFSIYSGVGNLPAHSKHYLPPILRDKGLTAAGVFANLCLSMCACLCISRKQWGRRS